MAKSQQSFNKKEKEKKRRKKKQDKAEKREERKKERAETGKKSFEDQIMYMDYEGNFTETPPDPTKKKQIKVEDIVLGVPFNEHPAEDPIRKGTVKFFNDEKGYGFIIDDGNKNSIFVHINNTAAPLKEHDKVQFEVEMGNKGPVAVNVIHYTPPPKPPKAPKPVDPAKDAATKDDASKAEAPKGEDSKVDAPKADAQKAEAPKVDAPKEEPKKTEITE